MVEEFWTCDAPDCTKAVQVGKPDCHGWFLLFVRALDVERDEEEDGEAGQGHACSRDHVIPAVTALLETEGDG